MVKKCDSTIDFVDPLLSSEQIKKIIKEKGWTQKEVAVYWGCHPNWISRLINNNGNIRGLRDDCAFIGLPSKK